MKYIMKDKNVCACTCGAICQPSDKDIQIGEAFSVEKGEVESFPMFTCPNCGVGIKVKSVLGDVPQQEAEWPYAASFNKQRKEPYNSWEARK